VFTVGRIQSCEHLVHRQSLKTVAAEGGYFIFIFLFRNTFSSSFVDDHVQNILQLIKYLTVLQSGINGGGVVIITFQSLM